MGLSSSLSTAISGLHSTQIGIGIVSDNVANAGSAGYIRRTVTTTEANSGGSIGTSTTQVKRLLDQIVQRQLWQESAGAAYTGARAESLTTLDQLFGTPGTANAFDAIYSGFTASLQALKNDPTSNAARTGVVDGATVLAQRLNDLSAGIQSLRTQTESKLANAVTDVNQLLETLASLNQKVLQGGTGSAAAALRDERDRVLSDLSQYIDIRTTESDQGSVSVFTASGVQIFDGRPSVTFEFDQHPSLSARSQWSADPAQRDVGTITMRDGGGNPTDAILNKTFRSGEIAAFIELRDVSLVQAQAQIDEIAAQLSSALSDRSVTATTSGTAPASAAELDFDLSGLSRGNTLTLDYRATAGGPVQRLTFVNATAGATLPAAATGDANNRVVKVDFSGGTAASLAAINAAITANIGAGFSVTNPSGSILRIDDSGSPATRDVVGLTANPSATGLTGQVSLPLFVDSGNGSQIYTGSLEGVDQFVGFSSRIGVNPLLVGTDRDKLVVYNTAPPTLQGDTTRPTYLLDRLNNAVRSFTRAVGVDRATATSQATVSSFVQRVVASQGQGVEIAKRLDEGQQIALSAVQGRFNETSKVSVDQEMSLLIELQSAYAANARIVSTVKEMMDVLMRI